MAERHTHTAQVELITDPDELARREAENGIRQTQLALEIIRSFVKDKDRPFKLRQGIILQLHAEALKDIHRLAGTYRNLPAKIHGSEHETSPALRVADDVAELRAVSYVVLSIKLDSMLPGTKTIPDQIADHKNPYYAALEKADRALKERGEVNVSELENLLSGMLANQLLQAIREAEAGGESPDIHLP